MVTVLKTVERLRVPRVQSLPLRQFVAIVPGSRGSVKRRRNAVEPLGRGGRVAEGAPLLRVYRETYRGFESLPLRHDFARGEQYSRKSLTNLASYAVRLEKAS